jgi:ribonuclease G
MKGNVVALDRVAGQPAAARMVNGRLDDLLLPARDAGAAPEPGTIFRAIAGRPAKGQGGAFMDLPEGLAGFLRKPERLRPGAPVLVQVTGFAEPGKAVPLTRRVLFKSRFAIVTPDAPGLNISRRVRDEETRVFLKEIASAGMAGSEAGLILRSASEEAGEDAIAEDIAAMRQLAEQVLADAEAGGPERLVDGPDAHLLAWRDWPVPDLLDEEEGSFARHGVLDAIDALAAGRADLGAGAWAALEPTRALVAVDVNTGADGSPAAGLKANLALARALPRELRCRGYGGQVTLDLAPMPKAQRRQWEQELKAAFRRDPVETVLAGWTPLGHFELQRKRERRPLEECLLP